MSSRLVARPALLALSVCMIATLTPSLAQAATPPTRWIFNFSDYVPRDAADTNPDYISVYRYDGQTPPRNRGLVVKIERGGAAIAASNYPSYWGSDLSLPDLRAGDTATLLDQATGAVVAAATFDGRPAFDDQTCVGRDTFSGLRTGATPLDEASTFRWVKGKGSNGVYGGPNSRWHRRDFDQGDITTLAGETFGGTFDAPVKAGAIVSATGHRSLSPTIIVSSLVERTVGACPPPVVPPVVVPPAVQTPLKDVLAPGATLTSAPKASKLKKISLKKLGSPGLSFTVTSTEAGTVSAVLELRKSSKKPAVVVGRASAATAAGATTPITLKLDKGTKRKLKGLSSSAKLVAVITVTDAAGNVTTLPEVSFKVPKA